MIRHSNQKWEIGQQVSVGFMRGLTVVEKIPTPGDHAPDQYRLTKGGVEYIFTPHKGIERVV